MLETGCSRAPCEWKGWQACFLANPTRRGDRTPLTYWSIVDASCCCRHRPGSPLRDAASVPVGGIDGSRIPSQGRLVGGKLDDFPGVGVASLPGDHGHGVHDERVDTTRRIISQRLPLPGAGADGSGGRHRMSGGAPTPDLFGSCADVIRPNGSMCLVVAGKSYPITGRELLLLSLERY